MKEMKDVTARMTSELPILYSFRRCPYAMRARLAIADRGYRVELREVVLRDKPERMLAASPKGTVPVLVLPDTRVIDESLDIILHVLREQGEGSWLPGDDTTFNEMTALIAACDGTFVYHLGRYKYAAWHEGADPVHHREQAAVFLAGLEERLCGSEYLFGDALSFADAAILPFVRQFSMPDPTWFRALPLGRVHRWLDRFVDSPLFSIIMQKHDPWQEGRSPLVFPPAVSPK